MASDLCSVCARVAVLTCAKCGAERYCGPDCLRTAGPLHSAHCRRWAEAELKAVRRPLAASLHIYALPPKDGEALSVCEVDLAGPDVILKLAQVVRGFRRARVDAGWLRPAECKSADRVAFVKHAQRSTQIINHEGWLPGSAEICQAQTHELTHRVAGALLAAENVEQFVYEPSSEKILARIPDFPAPKHLARFFAI